MGTYFREKMPAVDFDTALKARYVATAVVKGENADESGTDRVLHATNTLYRRVSKEDSVAGCGHEAR